MEKITTQSKLAKLVLVEVSAQFFLQSGLIEHELSEAMRK
jgi:hypothetical protein